ncbi:MAG TPA: Imm5 family immunity protein [Anaerolineaceae bacterium]|nr:Imm5 family immunity protein [Anaerolineaceae bacterium]
MTALPDPLRRMIVESMATMKADLHYHLPPLRRLAIYRSLNPRANPDAPVLARGWLAIITARRVLPVWHMYCPVSVEDNQLPDRLLSIARNAISGTIDLERAWHEANDLWFVAGSLGEPAIQRRTDVPNKAFYACDTALKAVHEVFWIEFLQKATEIEHTSDEYLQDWERDSAASAMIAEAGGADAGSLDLRKRHDFWEWWLSQAVPAAWVRSQEPVTKSIPHS